MAAPSLTPMRPSLPAPLWLAAAMAVALSACAPTAPTPSAGGELGQTPPALGERPNVVVLLADDLGYGDLPLYGHPTIRTPRIDALAREGIRLTSFTAGSSLCSPSRAALLTGRTPVRAGVPFVLDPLSEGGLPPGETTLAEALGMRGYRTAAVGKWHLGHLPGHRPTDQGFDTFFGLPYSNDQSPAGSPTSQRAQTYPPLPLWRDTTVVETEPDQRPLTQRYTEEAARFVAEAAGDGQPFFLYLAYAMPHIPVAASDPFAGRSRAGAYGDAVEEIDWSVGRVLDALAAAGVADDTVVLFASDNGPWLFGDDKLVGGLVGPFDRGSSGLLRGGKGTTFEGGFRVPGVVRWPGVTPPGAVSAEPISFLDVFPTLVRAAGGALPLEGALDGRDVRPLLAGGALGDAPFPYFDGTEPEAVRLGRWKLRVPPVTLGPPDDADDLSADVRALWDQEALYIWAGVTDSRVVTDTDERTHLDDNVELYVDGGGQACAGCYDADDVQLRFRPGRADISTNSATVDVGVVRHASRRTEGGYAVEIAVPWAALGVPPPEPGQTIGLDVHVTDDDAGGSTRQSKLYASAAVGAGPPDTQHRSAAAMARAVLTGDAGTATGGAPIQIPRPPSTPLVDGAWDAAWDAAHPLALAASEPPAGDAAPALYDLDRDPGERVDVSDQHPDVVTRLRRLLDGFRQRSFDRDSR